MPQYVGSKWKKTAALLRYQSMQPFIPKTVRFNQFQLNRMLDKFKMVYVKPENGTYGIGVMRVEQTASGYHFQISKASAPTKPLMPCTQRLRSKRRAEATLFKKEFIY